ncbi:MAG TPA: hypothetical protein PKY96_04745 [Flavobacteriales bacterium]|nr:hypothetical protein [Flavobacteriales bacterium]
MSNASLTTKSVRGMRVKCNQQWDAMRPMADGTRFCESCAKPVIDFTSWERPAMLTWFKQHPETCGQFRIDQVQPDLKPLSELPRDLLRGAFAALAALSIASAHAQHEPMAPAATEQLPSSGAKDQAYHVIQPPEDDERCWIEKDAGAVSAAPARRSRYYTSWRFPFIYKQRVFRGRIRVTGCPSF